MMKSSIIFSFFIAATIVVGCRKSDNARVPDLEKVPLPLITLAEGAETKIPGTNPETFSTTFTVDVYFKHGEQPKQFDLVVVKNGDKSNPKTIQAAITSFPVTVTLTGQQLIDLFGASIELGDAFDVGVDVTTQAGKKWAAFPIGGTSYAPGIAAQPGSNTQLRFAAPCLFDTEAYTAGDYEVVVDEWADFEPGDAVAVAKIDDTHFSFKYGAAHANPIIMEVDPITNAITVAPVMYGDYDGDEITAQSVPGDDSAVDPCDVSFSVKLNHVYSGGNLGNYIIKLKKL